MDDEYVEERDMLLLALTVVASVMVFTSEADGVIAGGVDVDVVVVAATTVPAMVAISPRVVVDIELDDCEDEFSR
ncbi:hypothetical protein pipiens_006780 [Culex pipiens pipiens]|uniref:Secreted protein n=1 Tax=Culex pipiens pipiens TaxID=38569 RepID=A0ABD1DNQ6_CULPP